MAVRTASARAGRQAPSTGANTETVKSIVAEVITAADN